MCYDVSFTTDIRVLGDYFPHLIFDSQLELEFGPIDHIQGVGVFGKQPIIYVNRDDMKLHVRMMEWGVIEHYRDLEPDFSYRNKFVNIRSERILDDKRSYWYKIRNRRCLIPLTGIFEHRGIKGWKKKVPYWVRPCNQQLFFLPGLYAVTEIADRDGVVEKRSTFGLITRAANALMKNIHNDGENRHRMPLFLPFEMSKEFISEDLSEGRYREILNYEIPSEELQYHPVFTIRTPKLRADNKPKSEYWEWDKLPALGELNPD
jgi:putative SOS response-associated peptidase YedK